MPTSAHRIRINAAASDAGAHLRRPDLGLPGLFPGPVNLQNTAVSGQTRLGTFGEVSLRVMKRLTVSAGVHSERTHYHAVTELAPILRSEGADSGVMPRFGLSYQAEERELLYLTVAKGYGSGGLWALLLECPGQPPAPIGIDTLWSYEVGAKSGLLDGRVQLDTGIFHIAWHNGQGYQLSNSNVGPCNSGYLGDPGAAASNGFDVAARALVGSHVEVGLALAYTDARYTRTLTGNGVVIARKGEAVGSYVPHVVSPWNVTASVDYKVAVRDTIADLRAEDIFRSRNPGPFKEDEPASAYYTPGNQPDPSINLLNLSATLRWASYDVALFVNNALDAQPVIMRCCTYPVFNGTTATTLRPRTVGLSACWRLWSSVAGRGSPRRGPLVFAVNFPGRISRVFRGWGLVFVSSSAACYLRFLLRYCVAECPHAAFVARRRPCPLFQFHITVIAD
jgi:iron complex outermembrane receptor protein